MTLFLCDCNRVIFVTRSETFLKLERQVTLIKKEVFSCLSFTYKTLGFKALSRSFFRKNLFPVLSFHYRNPITKINYFSQKFRCKRSKSKHFFVVVYLWNTLHLYAFPNIVLYVCNVFKSKLKL